MHDKAPNGRKLSFSKPERLLDAATSGDLEEVKALIEEGVDPNVRNCDGLTPLHWCVVFGVRDEVEKEEEEEEYVKREERERRRKEEEEEQGEKYNEEERRTRRTRRQCMCVCVCARASKW